MKILKSDNAQIEEILKRVNQQGLSYLNNLGNRSTSTENKVEIVADLNVEGIGALNTLKHFNDRFEPIIVASSGPRYLGFVIGGTTPASIAGDWLSTIYDQNPQAVHGNGDISAIIEIETIQLLLSLFNLPKNFYGGFVTGATLSNFTSLAVARQWIGRQFGLDFASEGISKSIKVLSATPHSSAVKSLSMLGIGTNNVIKVNVLPGNREAMDVEALEETIKTLKGEPFILISSAGTVNTVDFDDFEQINLLREKYNFWWHIDAAFGAFATCSAKYNHLIKGWENADSITIDCHKWLNVPYESAVFFVKEQHKILQIETFQNANAAYLGNPLDNFNYLNFLPENSRRLRALPTWFTLKSYGKTGYQEIVEQSVKLATIFATFIENNPQLDLLAPVRLNTVCFTLKDELRVTDFLNKLNATGKVFMTGTNYNNRKGIRAAFVNWRTNENDIDIITTTILKVFADLK